MKNRFVALVAVALFATVFAAGCGKHTKCADAKTEADCKKEKFEEGKFTCTWVKDAKDATKGTCTDTWKANDAAKGICDAASAVTGDDKARQSACDTASPEATNADATARCVWTADKKCEVAKVK